jgi:Lysyl oxidase
MEEPNMGKRTGVDRALKAISVVAAVSVVVLSVLLASGATGAPSAKRGTGTPVGAQGVVAAAAAAPVLPLPGKPGFPPKLDSAALTSQEILPDFVSGFPGIPTTPAIIGYPPIRQVAEGGATHNMLVFNTAYFNHGPGQVIVWGHRASVATPDMTGDQYIQLKNGGYALRPNVGDLRYINPTGQGLAHLHWHFVGAEVYAVYPAGHFSNLRRSQKQGFCMSEPPAVFTDYCGYKDPTELSQIQAMYAHTADFYDALVEGQFIDLTGLAAGKYVLINWVDSQCQVKETTYADNAASTAFTLSYPNGPNGVPAVTLGAELNGVPHPPCPAPAITAGQSARYLHQAVVKKSGGSVGSLRFRCSRASATRFGCHASWKRGATAYSGRISVANQASSKFGRYATALDGISATVSYDGTQSGHAHIKWSARMRLLPGVQPAHPVP